MNVQPFSPTSTASIAATTASASVSLPAGSVVRVVNAGSATAFIRWGAGTQTAVVTDMPILPASCELFSFGNANSVGAITASGTATLYFTGGEGQ